MTTDVVVIGAGAAGCATALSLRRRGLDCVVVDKSSGLARRFCGEFVSGEARAFLEDLDALEEFERQGPSVVSSMSLYGARGGHFEMDIARGGFGISRRALDGTLLELAKERGASVLRGTTISGIERVDDRFSVSLQGGAPRIHSRAVIGAHGRRANIDRLLGRPFIEHDSRYVGVKCHFTGVNIKRDVRLFLFPGGHCGLVAVEGRLATMAMLATREALRTAGGRGEDLIEFARRSNSFLDGALRDASVVSGSMLSIGQIPFRLKEQVASGVYFVGDAAGTTAPFLGLGVTNALRSGIACSGLVADSLDGKISSRQAKSAYEKWWRRNMRSTQLASFAISTALCESQLAEAALRFANAFPSAARAIYGHTRASAIRSGHGKDPFLSKA